MDSYIKLDSWAARPHSVYLIPLSGVTCSSQKENAWRVLKSYFEVDALQYAVCFSHASHC